MMIAFLAVLGAFLLPMYIAKLRHEEKKARLQLEAKSRGGGADDGEVKRITDENKLLRERVENLESIVCSVDFELNQKVAKLIDDHRSMILPPGAWPGAGAGAAAAGAVAAAPAPLASTVAASPSPVPAVPPAPFDRTATSQTPPGTPRPLTTTLEPGQVLAQRYRVQRLLGKGGMGAVYLADDEVLSELVALKVISSAFAADETAMIARFRREAAAARKVSSPSVIRIHDLGEARPGLLYLSMEYFAGRTLAELMAQRGSLPLDDTRDILKQIAGGLEAAHQAGVIHRDLKPSNVLIGERGAVKIIDFGLATTAMGEGLTATGAILGTPHYMAPEQVRGKAVDARSDIYALGALAYHLVCGRPPFTGDNAIAIGFAHLSEPPPPPRLLRKDCPPNLEAAILAALAKDPDDRPASARAFLEKATASSAA
jgi:serine/threonine-protein kinase